MASPIYDRLLELHGIIDAIPEEKHLFCPKVHDEDPEDYDDASVPGYQITIEEKIQRLDDYRQRSEHAFWYCLIFGIAKEQSDTWLPEWIDRSESYLTKCEVCARNWQMRRKPFLKQLNEVFDDGIVSIMETKLNEFDKVRIDRGLLSAQEFLSTHGPMGSGKLAKYDMAATLALYEALCCIPYLALPENRQVFNYVFQKTQERKVLKLGSSVLPTMTFFLFEEEPYRNRFAKTAWELLEPECLTEEQFDWAVNEFLANAIQTTARGGATLKQLTLFWEGILLILKSMGEEMILHSLRGMEVQPDIYHLAVISLNSNSDEVLFLVLKTLHLLMKKSSRAFWAALADVNRIQIPEEIFKSDAFRPLLARSLEDGMRVLEADMSVPFLPIWLKMFIKSLQPHELPDVCESLCYHLFESWRRDESIGIAGQTVATLAGLYVLKSTLEVYLDDEYQIQARMSLIYVNTVLNMVFKYKDIIVRAAELKETDTFNVGLSQAAMSIIETSLALDAKATRIEWAALRKKSPVNRTIVRNSAHLWDPFVEMLVFFPGKVKLGKLMLLASNALCGVERFEPPKRGEAMDEGRKAFNADFEKTAEVVGRMIDRLGDFNIADLNTLISDNEAIYPIIAALIHGEASIREAATSLIKSATGEDQRSEAVSKLLQDYFAEFLSAYCDVVKATTYGKGSLNPFGPMPNILIYNRDILNGLCDTTVGVLRSKSLSATERAAVMKWWTTQWECLQHAFANTRLWAIEHERKMMEGFARDVMERADALLAQDGVVASALGGQARGQYSGDANIDVMKTLLDQPRKNSQGMMDMSKLRDTYLLGLWVKTLVKLLRRLAEYDMKLDEKSLKVIRDVCTKRPDGKYIANSNLDEAQKAELLKALGEDSDDSDSLEYIGRVDKPKKQSTIDAWSKSAPSSTGSGSSRGTTPSSTIRTNRDDVKELTPNVDKYKATLDKMKSRAQPLKPDPKAIAASTSAVLEARQKAKAEKAIRDAEAIAKAKALRGPSKLVQGEGSGLQNLTGVPGKDHAPQKSEIMVDSSSEDDDDSEEEMVVSRTKRPGMSILDPARRRRELELLQKARGPVKKTKVQRSAKDMRARLIPPMDVLHQAILEWDIFHEGNDPPNGYKCEAVSSSYLTPRDYKQTFFPLLIYEAWRSFVTSKEESTSKPFGIRVINRMSVDRFLEVTTSMPSKANKDLSLSEGDIVLISKADNPLNEKESPHCLGRIWKTTYKKDTLEVAYRLNSVNNQLLPQLIPGAEFHAVKITNMTTIEREYAALESLQYYDLMDEIIKAIPSPILKFGEEAVGNVMKNYDLNPGQAKAILNAKENDGFTLIQGPPGTGKTKTIVAMVGALLTGHVGNKSAAVAIKTPHVAGQAGAPQAPSKKLLICAPSNAAVDEIVLRLKAGVRTLNGSSHKIEVLRLGRSDAINASVRDVTLDERVTAEMDAAINKNGSVSDRDKMHKEAGEIKIQLNSLRPMLEASRAENDRDATMKLQRQFDDLKRRQAHIGAKIDADKDSGNTYVRESEIKRRQIQQRILDSAQVLCATLSGSGHEMFKNLNVEFETVIIDEAAQSIELSALIPLKYGCSKCILVGDPKQLPPTVLSQSASRYGYDQSLFVRMQQNKPEDVHLLDRQYRMHPEISLFPSTEFYEGRLVDGDNMARLRQQPWHSSELLGPYRFFDVEGAQERGARGKSYVNYKEIQVAMQLYSRFRTDYSGYDPKGKIGIITPYKSQLMELRQRFTDRYGEAITDDIEFNTTDAFQGRECEIIIFSCVRAKETGGIGFMQDIRRMNVGLTRARSSLWILGDSRALMQGEFWGKLIKDAKARDRYTRGDVLSLLRQPGRKVAFPNASSAVQNGKLSQAPTPPVKGIDEDTDMPDAPTFAQQPSTYAMANQPPAAQPRGSIGGLNERGEALGIAPRLDGVPQIRTPASAEPGASKKRMLAGSDESVPPAKRIPQGNSRPIPTGPKLETVRPPKPAKKPTDPSAMETLGLVPPTRPPPVINSNVAAIPKPPSKPIPPPTGPKMALPPKKRAPADPFIQKKKPTKR